MHLPAADARCANGPMLDSAHISRRQLVAGALTALACRPSRAQPSLRLLCSGPPGSIPDTVARQTARALEAQHAGDVVVDNRAGAAGRIAVQALRAAAADGQTLLLAQGAVASIYPVLYPKLAYNAATDLQPVSLASEMSLGLAAGPAVPEVVRNVPALLDWLRKNPAEANAGSPGAGTLPHLLQAMLFREAGVDWQHVAYAGGPPALVALLAGQIAVLALPEGLLLQPHAAGRLRVLATSGAQRSASLPEVATLREQGLDRLVLREWFAFFAPGATPRATVSTRAEALQRALSWPALVQSFALAGMQARASTPAFLARRIADEQSTWAPFLRATGISAE
ncbi:MAG: twin-arginine translocation pathway signal protein [Comamonadaceae bacterium]|nr:MAG: twin-arginine translocation pathway signal protein [Comamonadaceae bacterium]